MTQRHRRYVSGNIEVNAAARYERLARLDAFQRMQLEAAVRLRELREQQQQQEDRETAEKSGAA